jgi:acyl dehydratase
MTLSTGIVGATVGPRVHDIDARWLMAYAAALAQTAPEYLDTTRAGGIRAHPLFPVCYEWPLALELRSKTLTEAVAARGVHATHDLTIHRPPRAGDRLSTTAAISAVEPRPPGAYVLMRFETVDADGHPVTTTDYGSLYLGVGCNGHPRPDPLPRRERESSSFSPVGRGEGEGAPAWTADIAIQPNLAHVYTECARIWNPIHTDRAVALSAGLPDIILHGTATLALAVSEVLRRRPEGPALHVSRISCRFGGMVRLPSMLRVEGWGTEASGAERAVAFQAWGADGRRALRDGRIRWRP